MGKILKKILAKGESSTSEFKLSDSKLDREIVAFANTDGGSIFIGVDDNGEVKGYAPSNKKKSEIESIARNIDPAVKIDLISHSEGILEILVPSSNNKPHRCREGFFLRNGASSIKLTRDEIAIQIIEAGHLYFDSSRNLKFNFEEDFDEKKFQTFLQKGQIEKYNSITNLLCSLNLAYEYLGEVHFTNTAVLLFAKNPQTFFPEAIVTFAHFNGTHRDNIISRADIKGSLIEQIEDSLTILKKINLPKYSITGDAQRKELYKYPSFALREAVTNAIMHRDYLNYGSRIYISLFEDRIEFENPGGLSKGLKPEEFGNKSVRRNPLIAQMLQRAGYVETLGSGIPRMQQSLTNNSNPDLEFSSTNYFTLRLYPASQISFEDELSSRQRELLSKLQSKPIAASQLLNQISYGKDTLLSELKELTKLGLVKRVGKGRAIKYLLKK